MTARQEVPKIRPAIEGDLSDLTELYAHLGSNDFPAAETVQKATFKKILDHSGMTILVASIEAKLVATLTLVIVPNLTQGCAPYALIENVVTRSEHRGQGIGQQLIAAAIQRAWDNGCYKVMLMSGSRNQKAHTFYQRAGFQQSKTGFEIRRSGYPVRTIR
ncbi:GNAT family N-acetyltransferase [Roseibium sp.]|uniref:GNAT family N-acetyltransferase n=1 Tax=Roseibium sp. TaxID=1936156 RepID=UPI002621F6FB|nr:GNAT family N-acetyltransferase [Roseibium sp.]